MGLTQGSTGSNLCQGGNHWWMWAGDPAFNKEGLSCCCGQKTYHTETCPTCHQSVFKPWDKNQKRPKDEAMFGTHLKELKEALTRLFVL